MFTPANGISVVVLGAKIRVRWVPQSVAGIEERVLEVKGLDI